MARDEPVGNRCLREDYSNNSGTVQSIARREVIRDLTLIRLTQPKAHAISHLNPTFPLWKAVMLDRKILLTSRSPHFQRDSNPQTDFATIRGVTLDPSGATIPSSAKIEITNLSLVFPGRR